MSILHAFLIIISGFIFTALITPVVKVIAIHIGAVDKPDERKVHKTLMPRIGGLAIFLGFLFVYMLFGDLNIQMISILIASFIIIITGICDDIKPLPANIKFGGQLVSACIIVFYGNILLTDITTTFFAINFGIFAPLVTIFFILGCINAINLIDGLDGLACGTSAIFFATVGIIAFITSATSHLDTTLALIMLGCTLGFLVHNFYPATIFMGDTGSMFLGLIIAVIALLGYKNVTLTSFIVPLLILCVPILDTLFAILRRIIGKKKISDPDKNHLHHQFLKMKYSHRSSVIMIYLINILFSIASILYVLGNFKLGLIIYATLFIIFVWLVVTTDIIYENKPKETINEKNN